MAYSGVEQSHTTKWVGCVGIDGGRRIVSTADEAETYDVELTEQDIVRIQNALLTDVINNFAYSSYGGELRDLIADLDDVLDEGPDRTKD